MSNQEPKRPHAQGPVGLPLWVRVVLGIIVVGFVLAVLVFGTCVLLYTKH